MTESRRVCGETHWVVASRTSDHGVVVAAVSRDAWLCATTASSSPWMTGSTPPDRRGGAWQPQTLINRRATGSASRCRRVLQSEGPVRGAYRRPLRDRDHRLDPEPRVGGRRRHPRRSDTCATAPAAVAQGHRGSFRPRNASWWVSGWGRNHRNDVIARHDAQASRGQACRPRRVRLRVDAVRQRSVGSRGTCDRQRQEAVRHAPPRSGQPVRRRCPRGSCGCSLQPLVRDSDTGQEPAVARAEGRWRPVRHRQGAPGAGPPTRRAHADTTPIDITWLDNVQRFEANRRWSRVGSSRMGAHDRRDRQFIGWNRPRFDESIRCADPDGES